MSCDDYDYCPKCGKFEALKIWYGEYRIIKNGKIFVDITEPHGHCRECDFKFKGFELWKGDKDANMES